MGVALHDDEGTRDVKEPVLLTMDKVAVADVIVRDRLRPVSEAAVASLIASIGDVMVMKAPIDIGKMKDGKLILIAGGHRLAAAKRLGWETIRANIWDRPTADWMRLMEVDDNLAGAEMTALDTAIFLATRKLVYERMHPETKAGAFKGNQHVEVADMMSVASFAKSTAEKFGLSERHIRRLLEAGSKIHADKAHALRAATRPVTLKDLMDLSKIGNPVERDAAIDARAKGEVRSIAEARRVYAQRDGTAPVAPPETRDDKALNTLRDTWNRCSAAVRRKFATEFGDEVIRWSDNYVDDREAAE